MHCATLRLRDGVGATEGGGQQRTAPRTFPELCEAVDSRDEAVRLLGSLTPRKRAAIVLTEALGYSAEEAGRLLGSKGSTVRALRFQARTALDWP